VGADTPAGKAEDGTFDPAAQRSHDVKRFGADKAEALASRGW
jgi:hypothetical protein